MPKYRKSSSRIPKRNSRGRRAKASSRSYLASIENVQPVPDLEENLGRRTEKADSPNFDASTSRLIEFNSNSSSGSSLNIEEVNEAPLNITDLLKGVKRVKQTQNIKYLS